MWLEGKATNSVVLCTRLATVDHCHASAALPPARVRIPAANQSELRAAFGEGPAHNSGEWLRPDIVSGCERARSPHGSRQKCPARRMLGHVTLTATATDCRGTFIVHLRLRWCACCAPGVREMKRISLFALLLLLLMRGSAAASTIHRAADR